MAAAERELKQARGSIRLLCKKTRPMLKEEVDEEDIAKFGEQMDRNSGWPLARKRSAKGWCTWKKDAVSEWWGKTMRLAARLQRVYPTKTARDCQTPSAP